MINSTRPRRRYRCFHIAAIAALALSARSEHAQTIPLIPVTGGPPFADDASAWPKGLNIRTMGNQLGNAIRNAGPASININSPVSGPKVSNGANPHGKDGSDIQINDPNLDHILTFTGAPPFEESTQSETSVTQFGQHTLVGYNSSANAPIINMGGNLVFTHLFFSAFSISHDGGATWTSGFLPPPPGSIVTLGDPAVGVDRAGNFYYSSLALDSSFNTVIAVNKSTDHGNTFGPGIIVKVDNGSDKDWMAVGPDPAVPSRDNLYVTWTSFQPNNSAQLWLAKSIDGGATWTSKSIFAPSTTAIMSNQLTASNPVVDPSTGRLYISFLHFSFIDADMIRVLVSDDAGATFHFLSFNIPGAPDAFAYPNVTPGEFADCGTEGGLRNVLHQGSDIGGGQFGLARYTHATRIITQPSAGADRGRFAMAFNTSTSRFFGDPTAGSEINVLYSQDGGTTWSGPTTVAPSTANDRQHVHPSLALGQNGNTIFVGYYVQQADTRLRTDAATLHIDGNHLGQLSIQPLSTTAFDLTPSNIPFPNLASHFTTNYDQVIVACYDIGEYMSVQASGGVANAAWGDNRRSWTSPPTSPAAGTHAQPDVFFRTIGK